MSISACLPLLLLAACAVGAAGQDTAAAAASSPESLQVAPFAADQVVIFGTGSETRQIQLSNPGSSTVEFEASIQLAGIFGGWLTASPSSGLIPAGSTATITISYTAETLWQGQYHASLGITTDSSTNLVNLPTLLVFCPEMQTSLSSLPAASFPEAGATITQVAPVWDTAELQGEWVWLEVPIRFSHPVVSLPIDMVQGLITEKVLEIVGLETRGAMCGDFAVRVRAPIKAWQPASTTSVCVLVKEGIMSVNGLVAFPGGEHCVVVQHQAHGRLFAPFLAYAADSGLVTDQEEVTLLMMFSGPVDLVTFVPSSFVISGPKEAVITSMKQVHDSGTQWHVTMDVGGYYGQVNVGLASTVRDSLGQPLTPVRPLQFTREFHSPMASAGYIIRGGPAAEL